MATFNIKKKKLSDCMPLSTEVCLIMASSHEESNLNPFFFKSTFASSICWKEEIITIKRKLTDIYSEICLNRTPPPKKGNLI